MLVTSTSSVRARGRAAAQQTLLAACTASPASEIGTQLPLVRQRAAGMEGRFVLPLNSGARPQVQRWQPLVDRRIGFSQHCRAFASIPEPAGGVGGGSSSSSSSSAPPERAAATTTAASMGPSRHTHRTASPSGQTPATSGSHTLSPMPNELETHRRSLQAHLQIRLATKVSSLPDTRELPAKVKKGAVKVVQKTWQVSKRVLSKTWNLTCAFVKNPKIVFEWYEDIREAVKHFLHWVYTGFKIFGGNVQASYYLIKRVAKGYPLKVRERQLLVRTTSDCLKLVPFSFFLIVPFAELALPLVLRIFPNMLPSSFFQQKFDNATLARKFKAKEEMAEFFQDVVHQRTKELVDSSDDKFADKRAELEAFQEKLLEGKEYPTLKEILKFSKLFRSELSLQKMSDTQLSALSRMLGLPQAKFYWPGHLEVQLRHHITQLRREDRDYAWEGIDGLTHEELVEACRKRAIRFHEVTEKEMREGLARWLDLSANNRAIPTSVLLWIQSFYLRAPGAMTEEALSDLRMKEKEHDAQAAEEENQPTEAFHGVAERQKALAESAEERLGKLQKEINEVMQVLKEDTEPDKAASADSNSTTLDEELSEEEESRWSLEEAKRAREKLHEQLQHEQETSKLYKLVVQSQKDLLDEQLKFLLSMRENKPTKNKDADIILLDQRIRLMEMIGAFQKRYSDIEKILRHDEEPISKKDQIAAAAAMAAAPPVAEEVAAGVIDTNVAAQGGPSSFGEGFASSSFGNTGLMSSESKKGETRAHAQ
mmetsp:Transcript_11626/g.25594  ORF Transcript_11626/g.25594 Transcript_11626/m.25594 type:complete len:766 (+) Transcript_11626:193-2490(+)